LTLDFQVSCCSKGTRNI